MTKYLGKDYELRLATSEGGLASATALSRWESVNIKVKQGRKKSPVGLGSRLQEVQRWTARLLWQRKRVVR